MPGSLNIEQFLINIRNMINTIPEEVQRISIVMSASAIPLITNRLIDRGLKGDGQSLGEYSTNPLSPNLFLNKGLGSGADEKVKQYVARQKKNNPNQPPGISYKTFRELNNLPVEHVTLSFTGETLGDLGVLQTTFSNGKVITEVGSKNSKTKEVFNKRGRKTGTVGTGDVLDQLQDRYGDILSLTTEEEEAIDEIFDFELQQFVNRFLA